MRSFLTGLFIVILAGLVLTTYFCVFIVDESKTALVIRFGKVQKQYPEAGLKFKLPWDQVLFIDKRILYKESKDLEVYVNDDSIFEVDAITMYRISDVQKFRETLSADPAKANLRIDRQLNGILREVYGKRSFRAALTEDRARMMVEIRDKMKSTTSDLGIEIVDVRIRKTDLSAKVLKNTYQRMVSERAAEAQAIRSQGEAEKIRIMAEADREAVEIVAIAERNARIIRGQGEAQRNKIFAEAFTKDPEFFAFYRSMQAYKESFKGANTRFVLSPDSEFFKYLKSSTGAVDKK